MDKINLDELKKRLEKAEFNNKEEDERIREEEIKPITKNNNNNNNSNNDNEKKKNITIAILGFCVFVLLIIVVFFLFSGNNDNNNSSNNENKSNNENTNNENGSKDNNEVDEKVINEKDYNYSTGNVLYNRYVVLDSLDDKKKVVADLDGNILLKVSPSWKIYNGPDNSLYAVNLNYTNNGSYSIKMIKDNLVHDILSDKFDGLLLDKDKDIVLGAFKKDTNNDIYYIFDGNNYNTVTLGAFGAYEGATKDNKYIYNNKYVITYEAQGESFKNYGIYDIKANKHVINGTYDEIEYLHDNLFEAVNNNKSGVINIDNKTLLDFKYDLITYENGLYFVGQNGELRVLDKDFNDLNLKINVPNLNLSTYSAKDTVKHFYLESFKDLVIVKVGSIPGASMDLYAISKNGTSTPLGKGYTGFVGDYLVVSNENDNIIKLFDGALNIAHKFDVGEKAIKLDNISIFLKNTLVINNNKLYNLKDDTTKGTTSWYTRIQQDYSLRLDFKGEKGTITISYKDEVVKKLEDVTVSEFLKADNNGMNVTKNYFIYNAGGVIIIKREAQ